MRSYLPQTYISVHSDSGHIVHLTLGQVFEQLSTHRSSRQLGSNQYHRLGGGGGRCERDKINTADITLKNRVINLGVKAMRGRNITKKPTCSISAVASLLTLTVCSLMAGIVSEKPSAILGKIWFTVDEWR